MSADLFAAFDGSFPKQKTSTTVAGSNDYFSVPSSTAPTRQSQPQSLSTTPWPADWRQLSQNVDSMETLGSPAAGQNAEVSANAAPGGEPEEDDTWGDFESAVQDAVESPTPAFQTSLQPQKIQQKGPPNQTTLPVFMSPISPAAPPTGKPESPSRCRLTRASTLEIMTNILLDLGPPQPPTTQLKTRASRPTMESGSSRRGNQQAHVTENPDTNVLFDADDYEGKDAREGYENDFGDFETGEASPATAHKTHTASQPVSALDLLSMEFAPTPLHSPPRKASPSALLVTLGCKDMSPYPQAPKSPSFHERNPFPGLELATSKSAEFPAVVQDKSPSPVTAWPSMDDQHKQGSSKAKLDRSGVWAGVELATPGAVTPVENPGSGAVSKKTPPETKEVSGAAPAQDVASDWEWDTWDTAERSGEANLGPSEMPCIKLPNTLSNHPSSDKPGPPPTNIPPPSILLSLFPDLLHQAFTSLFHPVNNLPASIKERVLSSPSTATFLRGFCALATVAVRIIAGRKVRWHRDKFLSQFMTISAATGGSRRAGLKLLGIDKTQANREDHETAGVVDVWRPLLGRLRNAVSAANAANQASSIRVPELSELPSVQAVKGVPTAVKACCVCGLKREERIGRVDVDVEDSFGEWWVEHWGHRDCRNFWLEHEERLRQR